MAVTLKHIAENTGYAVSTVSNVLNGRASCRASTQAREAIREAARHLGYRPHFFGRGLRMQRSHLIGVAASLFGSGAAGKQMRAIASRLAERGYSVLFGDTRSEVETERAVVSEMRHKQVEGLVLQTGSEPGVLQEMIPPALPVVLLTHAPVPDRLCLVVDFAAASEKAVRHLAKLGHRRIAFLTPSLAGNTLKLKGYERAMRGLGLHGPRLRVETPSGAGETQDFVASRGDLFQDFTAVLASNDTVALEVMSGLGRLGLQVPRDCSVVGFDDGPVASATCPKLTTLRQPHAEVGRRVSEMLLRGIDAEATPSAVLAPELVERDSTGPCKRG